MTYTGAEMLVAQRFEEASIEHYLPLMHQTDRRRKKNPITEVAMFPGYLFARIHARQIYPTRTTQGVIKIVSTQHSIIPVPDKDIEAVRLFEASQRKVYLHETTSLVKGARVTLQAGEFEGMEGTLVKHCKDGNFCISIDVMNLSIVTHVRRDELRLVTP